MGDRKESKRLAKVLNGSVEPTEDMRVLKDTAASIQKTAVLYEPTEVEEIRAKARLLNKIDREQRNVTIPRSHRFKQQIILKPQRRFAMSWIFVAVTLMTLAGGAGTVYASSDSLPGDMLYPVKIAAEDMRLALSDDAGDVELLLDFMDERVDEMDALLLGEDMEGIELAEKSYSNHQELLTNLMTKMKPEDPVAGDALEAQVQSRVEEQARRMLNIQEEVGERIQTQEKIQDQTATQTKTGENNDVGGESSGNGGENGQQGEQQGQQGQHQGNQDQSSFVGPVSATLQSYSISLNDRLSVHFYIDASNPVNLYAQANGIVLACSTKQNQVVCEGPLTQPGAVLVELYDMDNGTLLVSHWITVDEKGNSGDSGGSAGGTGGNSH